MLAHQHCHINHERLTQIRYVGDLTLPMPDHLTAGKLQASGVPEEAEVSLELNDGRSSDSSTNYQLRIFSSEEAVAAPEE